MAEKKIGLVHSMLAYAGSDVRMDDLFANQDILARTKNVLKGLKVRACKYINLLNNSIFVL